MRTSPLLTFSISFKRRSEFTSLLPPDADNRCGLYVHLPQGHPFNVVCELLHDPGHDDHHNGFATNIWRLDKGTVKNWWGVAMDQPSLVGKFWYGAQAAIGAGIIYTIGLPVWVIGGGSGG